MLLQVKKKLRDGTRMSTQDHCDAELLALRAKESSAWRFAPVVEHRRPWHLWKCGPAALLLESFNLFNSLNASGEHDQAITEFKEAISLDLKQSQVILALAAVFEKKGDCVNALEQYRKAKADGNQQKQQSSKRRGFLFQVRRPQGIRRGPTTFSGTPRFHEVQGKGGGSG